VNVSSADVVPDLRNRLVAQLQLSFDQLPTKHGAVILRGRFGARVEDRETRLVNKVNSDEPVHTIEVESQATERRVLGENQKPPVPSVDRTVPIELRDAVLWNSSAPPDIRIGLDFSWRKTATFSGHPSSLGLEDGQLFDADGEVVGRVESYSWSGEACDGSSRADFSVTCQIAQPRAGKAKWKRPLVFQGAVSANNCWPLQLNIELPPVNQVLMPKSSPLVFRHQRESQRSSMRAK